MIAIEFEGPELRPPQGHQTDLVRREHDVSGERRIKTAKLKHAMTNIRIGAAASSSVLDQLFCSSEAFDVAFG